jgi:hypothetical protein
VRSFKAVRRLFRSDLCAHGGAADVQRKPGWAWRIDSIPVQVDWVRNAGAFEGVRGVIGSCSLTKSKE